MSVWQAWYQRWLARRLPAASQIKLSGRRVFIMPSRVGGAFAVVLLLMLLAAINYENSLAYGLTFLLASVYLLAIFHTYRNFAGLVLKASTCEAVFVGEQAHFAMSLESVKREHQSIAVGWLGQELRFFDVPAQGGCAVQLHRLSEQRGWLASGRIRVESRFPLGLLQVWSWVDLGQRVLVYPQPLAGDLPQGLAGAAEHEDQGVQAKGSGVDDFQGLRQYQAGDSRKRLQWKAYSRGQGLQVKDFSSLLGRDVWLDFHALPGDIETRLSVLCYWVLTLEARQQCYGLRLPGGELAPSLGGAQRDACLRALALYGQRT